MKRFRVSCVLVVVFLFTGIVQAGIIFDTGTIPFTATGTQFGRIGRDGVSSNWGEVKTFPGVTLAPTPLGDETFTVNVGSRTFIQISLDDPAAVLFDAAYSPSFLPALTPPGFGLDVNYLGDPGLSQPLGNPSYFQIVAAPDSTLVINVNEVAAGVGAGNSFDLLVEGFYSADYSDVPEPASVLLGCGGIALLAVLRRRRSA